MRLSFYLLFVFGAVTLADFIAGQPRKTTSAYPTSLYQPTGAILPSKEEAELSEYEIKKAYKIPITSFG